MPVAERLDEVIIEGRRVFPNVVIPGGGYDPGRAPPPSIPELPPPVFDPVTPNVPATPSSPSSSSTALESVTVQGTRDKTPWELLKEQLRREVLAAKRAMGPEQAELYARELLAGLGREESAFDSVYSTFDDFDPEEEARSQEFARQARAARDLEQVTVTARIGQAARTAGRVLMAVARDTPISLLSSIPAELYVYADRIAQERANRRFQRPPPPPVVFNVPTRDPGSPFVRPDNAPTAPLPFVTVAAPRSRREPVGFATPLAPFGFTSSPFSPFEVGPGAGLASPPQSATPTRVSAPVGSPLGAPWPGAAPGLTAFNARPLPSPQSKGDPCRCPPKQKQKRKKKPRDVCYRGEYVERRNGLLKFRERKVPCK